MSNSDEGNYADGKNDEDVLSGVEQPIDDNDTAGAGNQADDVGLTQTTRQSANSLQKKKQVQQAALSSPKRSQVGFGQTFGNEDELDQVADLDELELLSDVVMQFEQTAFDTKKRVNALDRLTYKSQLLPPTLRMCYQALSKSWMQDAKNKNAKSEFDSDNLEFLLSDAIKQSGICIKEFSKFKGEFYALNEPIINKDISNLSLNFVNTQLQKQQQQAEKLALIEDRISMNDGQIEELKNKFETFQSDKFDEKQRYIEQEGLEVKELVAELDEKDEQCATIFKETSKLLKESRPQTKEQRSKHSDINSRLQKAERKYQKWKSNFDQHCSKQAELHDQIEKCQKIVENLEELAIKTMVAQSKKMQKLIDCSIAVAKFKIKLQALIEDQFNLLKEAQQLQQSCIEFQKTLLDDLLAEYQDLVNKIRGHNQNLEDEIMKINESLSNFENKVGEMKISEQDHFFLNKEILRFKTAISSLDSQRSIHIEETEGIEDSFNMNSSSIDNENVCPISQQDLEKLRENLKLLQKQDEVELPKIKKGVDGLEQYVMRSLKNQLNGDNKLSQTNISKVKKNYEEFLKIFEKLNHTYNDCVQKVNNFNSKFDSDDLERRNELKELQERLKEEEQSISGAAPKRDSVITEENSMEEEGDISLTISENKTRQQECLQKTKRQIIEAINSLVNQFNEITKILRDSSGKSLKAEGPLNDLISKNKQIQSDCTDTHELIDGAKKTALEIQQRLLDIINSELLEELMKKYKEKENLIDDCIKARQKAEKQQSKIGQQLGKYIEAVEEQVKKLDMFNPINGTGCSHNHNQDFLDEISEKIDSTNDLLNGLQKLRDDNQYVLDNINQACLPLDEVGDREVLTQELDSILKTLDAVNDDLNAADSDLGSKQQDIAKLQKDVKALIGQEVEGRLKVGQGTLDVVDEDFNGCNEVHNNARKKLKNFRDLIDKTHKNQGKNDQFLLEKLDEMNLEANQIDDMMNELNNKLNDQKRKKTEARRQMDDMVRGMQGNQKFKPNQLEGVLSTLDELKDKNGWISEKLQNIDNKTDAKLQELEELVSNCEKKQELQIQMNEAEAIMEEDLTNLRDLLDKLPKNVKQLKSTIAEMSASSGPGDDYQERKQELEEQQQELDEIEIVLEKFEETFGVLKDERDKLKKQKGKLGDIQLLQKLLEQIQDNKDQLSSLFTDALDTQEQLQDLKNDVGDCDIPILLNKRKNELSQFSTKGERMKKELLNLKKAKKSDKSSDKAVDEKIAQQLKELEFKLKIFDKDKADLLKLQQKELDPIQPLDYDDMGKASDILKKIRKFKNQVNEAEQKLHDLEEVQNDIVKRMTEQDLENSTDLLALKAQELRDRLKESKQQLQQIQASGEMMDGNTSTNEEEDFIQALKNEMPEVLDNIETNLGLLVEIEKLVPEVKQSMSLEKMNDLREKVEIATENVEESEGLVVKLEKEIIEWNSQKKLCKRDCELEEAKNLLNDYIDDLSQEKQNTEIELNRNREKQEENRDQEMVDKDGKKVDIMKDLIRLEEEMMNYLKEIDNLLEEIQDRENLREKLFEDFNKQVPRVIIEERQRRAEHIKSLKPPERQLKRPPMMLKKPKAAGKSEGRHQEDQLEDDTDPHSMLKTNCKFRKPIKGLLKDLKGFNQVRKDLEDKYAQMRREVFKIKQIKLYKPVQGDAVDEMFAGYLNKAKLTIEVQRISASNYMFGTKKILAKIINGRLVIRVGGGYMNAEEFIEQYGKIEMMKIMKMEEKEGGFDTHDNDQNLRSTMGPQNMNPRMSMRVDTNTSVQTPNRRGTIAPNSKMMNQLGDAMKEKMRQQLQFVKAYDSQNTVSMKEKQKMRQTITSESMKSLGNSMKQKGMNTSNNKLSKPQTAEEKEARNKEAKGKLTSALSNIQSNYRSTQANFDGSSSARRVSTQMESLVVGRGGSKSPSGPNSAIGPNLQQPVSGAKASSSKIGGLTRRGTILGGQKDTKK